MEKDYAIKFPCAVRRFRMAWRDGRWVVLKSLLIRSMTLPRSLNIPTTGQRDGGFFDAVDRKGNVFYRCPAPNPELQITETFERDGLIKPHLLKGMEQTVEVLIPDHRSFKSLVYRPIRTRANDSKQTEDQSISIDEISSREKK